MKTERTFDILANLMTICPEKEDILACKVKGQWIKYSVKEYLERVESTSCGLMELGLQKGDRVVTISNNRPEWNFMDMALSRAGMVHVPVYPTISVSDYSYILNDCKPKLLIVSDKALYEKINPIARKVNSIKGIFSYNKIDNVRNWEEIPDLGRQNIGKHAQTLKKLEDETGIHEMVTLIYTSGTTGNPKGVMLSHSNIMSNVKTISEVYDFNHTHRTLSFLPISHVFERTINYYFQSVGISVYYAENLGTIAENLKEVQPHLFISVPRLLERTYDKIISKGRELTGIKKRIFFWAVNLGMKYRIPGGNSALYKIRLKLADKLVFSKWREALGGKVQLIVVGGAALQPRLAIIFNAAGIPVVEGYGLTESSPVIAANRKPETGDLRVGTVGPAIPGVEIRIADDGEILCKGPNIMLGYYNHPGLTREVIDKEGWLHTGDIGMLVEDRYLKITDRKKEMFKLSSGKYIAPQIIENKLKESMFIEQVMVIGENQKFASAIISPDFPFLHNWSSMHNISFQDNKELIQNPDVIARYQKEVSEINKHMGQTEQIKRFRLVHEEWNQDTGELSPTLKLRRKILAEKYADLIREIFSLSNNRI
ncbi:MAG: long-chain fatty acid--CoA ligase [Bacteroidales bacterium]|nr:long-chain fatty acid--CoA ligase [Bacteroidales bacterium]